MKKLIYLFLTVFIVACSSEDSNNQDNNDGDNNDTNCEYVLNTLPVTNATTDSATFNGIISLEGNCEFPITEQGFVYSTELQPTIADSKININGNDVTTTIGDLEPNTTYYARTFLTNDLGDFYGNEVSFTTNETICDVVYLDENGITIKAYECAEVGETGVVNGVTYTVVDEAMLREMIADEEDVTKIATTKVTDMRAMFANTPFNQPIGNWDVSNVTDMWAMFTFTNFNQDISSWDVSNVTDMTIMFKSSPFNRPIGNWDVSNVTSMQAMFWRNTNFNQPIGNWDVSNVTYMAGMFEGIVGCNIIEKSKFSQDISSWDVSNVTDMRGMFSNGKFNQPIGNWDVSNVTDMSWMFKANHNFNQPIGDWDVSNVTDMDYMFESAISFNQPIGNWDVGNVTNMHSMFSFATSFNQPIGNWDVSNVTDMGDMFRQGTCCCGYPGLEVYYNFIGTFNQDISSWNVSSVTICDDFSFNTPAWTLPQPNFTNCTP